MNSELFDDYDRLLQVDVLGQNFDMPENNTLLRGFQYGAPEAVAYGPFCWNGACENCAVTVTVTDDGGECAGRRLACITGVVEGLRVTELSYELRETLGQP